jgi:AcrR family transcriptional regulator
VSNRLSSRVGSLATVMIHSRISMLQDETTLLVTGARAVLAEHGWQGASMERIAKASGISRMTLHRRGVTRGVVLDALALALEEDYRAALWPALTAPGSARERLRLALEAECEVAEANLAVLGALEDAERSSVFHARDGRGLTRPAFTEPLIRLLADGAADGSLRPLEAEEAATVLFNMVGFAYRHLRAGHGWSPERACGQVLDIALSGVHA